MKYFDPVSYQFYFTCINNSESDNNILKVFHEFLGDSKKYVFEYMNEIELQHVAGVLCTFINSRYSDLHLYDGKCLLWDRFISGVTPNANRAGITQIGHGMKQEYYARASGDQKQYNRLINSLICRETSKPDAETDEAIIDQLYYLLNCPNPYLSGITFCSKGMDGFLPFHIEYEKYKVGTKRDEPQLIGFTGDRQNGFRHTISVEIPRYVIREDFPFQTEWKNRLIHLCEDNYWSYGSITMDAFKNGSMSFSGLEYYLNICHFAGCLPGYSWAVCYNGEHAKLMGGRNRITKSKALREVKPLSNGGVYVQLSDDICFLTKEINDMAAGFFSPYLPDVLWPAFYPLPVSYRLSVDKNNILLPSKQDSLGGGARYYVRINSNNRAMN